MDDLPKKGIIGPWLPVILAGAAVVIVISITVSRGPFAYNDGQALLLVWEFRDGQAVAIGDTLGQRADSYEPPSFSPTSGEFFLPSWASRPWLEQSLLVWRPDEPGPAALRWSTPRPWRRVPLARGGPDGPAVGGVDSEGRVSITYRDQRILLIPGDTWGTTWREGAAEHVIRVEHRGLYRMRTMPDAAE